MSEHDDLRRRVEEGLVFAHARMNSGVSKTLESTSFLYALVELLEERGLVSVDELDERREAVATRLVERIQASGEGVMIQEPEEDKYEFRDEVEIDCPSLVHLCKASCCRLPFALSKQDVREGIVRWELGRPYMNEHGDDGYCSHIDGRSRMCSIRDSRPVPCRAFDCRGDSRIWADFDNRIPNPNLDHPDWPRTEIPDLEARAQAQPQVVQLPQA